MMIAFLARSTKYLTSNHRVLNYFYDEWIKPLSPYFGDIDNSSDTARKVIYTANIASNFIYNYDTNKPLYSLIFDSIVTDMPNVWAIDYLFDAIPDNSPSFFDKTKAVTAYLTAQTSICILPYFMIGSKNVTYNLKYNVLAGVINSGLFIYNTFKEDEHTNKVIGEDLEDNKITSDTATWVKKYGHHAMTVVALGIKIIPELINDMSSQSSISLEKAFAHLETFTDALITVDFMNFNIAGTLADFLSSETL
jgi:hypothetical protein